MARFVFPRKMKAWSLWALWWFLIGIAVSWLLVGSVAYWVKHGWLPPDASGWVQALGAILAVAVAVALPAWQRSGDERLRQKQQREREITTYLQLNHLVVEVRALLVEKSSYLPDHELTARCLEDILGRLNVLTASSYDRLLLKLSLDLRIVVHGFLRLVSPIDKLERHHRRNLLQETVGILVAIHDYTASVEADGEMPIGVSS